MISFLVSPALLCKPLYFLSQSSNEDLLHYIMEKPENPLIVEMLEILDRSHVLIADKTTISRTLI